MKELGITLCEAYLVRAQALLAESAVTPDQLAVTRVVDFSNRSSEYGVFSRKFPPFGILQAVFQCWYSQQRQRPLR
jgi:hypothetical protein